ncbi:tyrosine-type recombinase/integrase [Algisphaera agarilytica]|uniref:Core-binding (CB) domain-containing protein n=1 Tax=Algisphaera agarilytica TaxID=1385975 RepID=A0A7X0HAH3_9BACT|nr:tyrosine-type recombinase/integrase [Algisphaera agarilytica]MBB6431136.1 hypothetical protein [Algisphaera agarilytica]
MTAHKNGQWCKKILGKIHYFGGWDAPDGALDRYLAVAADLHAGRPANTSPSSGSVTVAGIFNEYLADREADVRETRRDLDQVTEGGIGAATFNRYRRAGAIVADVLGAQTDADDLKPADFARLRNRLKANYRPETMANYTNAIKTVFRWAYEDAELLTNAPRFGNNFAVKSLKRSLRQSREQGRKRLFTPEQIHKLLAVGTPLDRACILLAINCGFGATDCGDLEEAHIDRDLMLIDMPRPKTMVPRICPVWQETLDAIDEAQADRPTPTNPRDADKLLLSPTGRPLTSAGEVRRGDRGEIKAVVHYDDVFQRFLVLCRMAEIDRPKGWGFRVFRTTFATIGKRSGNSDAVKVIMGHADGEMLEHYVEEEDYTALRAVSDHVYRWLYDK